MALPEHLRPKRTCAIPVKLGDALADFLKTSGLKRMMEEQEVLLHWKEVVGETIAAHAVPDTLSKGVLVLKVDNSAWRTELYSLKEDLMDKINAAAGKRLVRDIRLQ